LFEADVDPTSTVLTFGHGTADQRELTALLEAAKVRLVVDVRRFPGSRRHPHVATAELAQWLPGHGIEYRWEPRLGGRRRVPPEESGSDPWWKVEAFRAYAAHTRTLEFQAALTELMDEVTVRPEEPVAVMCSESLWWRCHRRLIADVLVLLHQIQVAHLGHDGGLTTHVPAAGARVSSTGLRYDSAS
jgi:uncharacterized protein (DUF488 family)